MNLADHLDLLATAPDGIKHLRGLIPEPAMRGKLAPQNPTDYAASPPETAQSRQACGRWVNPDGDMLERVTRL